MGEKLSGFAQHGTTFVAGLILAFIRGPDLTAVVLTFMPLMAGGAAAMKSVLERLQKSEQDGYAAAGAAAGEAIASMRVVAAYAGEEAETARYAVHLKKSEAAGIKKGFAMGMSLGVVQFGIMSSYGVGLWYGATKVLHSREVDPLCRIDPLRSGCFTGGQIINCFFATIIAAFGLAQGAWGAALSPQFIERFPHHAHTPTDLTTNQPLTAAFTTPHTLQRRPT
jgi:ABC-type multidrug transport system fused ATPase/permease subunit